MTTTTLYRFLDAAGALLYIGVASNPARRFEQHARSKPWWADIAVARIEHHPTRKAALAAERSCDKASAYVRRLDQFRHIDGSDYRTCQRSIMRRQVMLTWSPPDWWWQAFPLTEEPEAACPCCGEPSVWVPLIGRYVHAWYPSGQHGDARCWDLQAA